MLEPFAAHESFNNWKRRRWRVNKAAAQSTSEMTVWTIGHSTRTFDQFLQLLQCQDMRVVADVRRFPGSRKYPQFNAESLTTSLREHEIGYEWFEDLGGRR